MEEIKNIKETEIEMMEEAEEETDSSNHGCCIDPCEFCPGRKSCTGLFTT